MVHLQIKMMLMKVLKFIAKTILYCLSVVFMFLSWVVSLPAWLMMWIGFRKNFAWSNLLGAFSIITNEPITGEDLDNFFKSKIPPINKTGGFCP